MSKSASILTQPHAPDETAARGYGDCKDKTLLLTALLRELDIKATPALVNTRLGRSLDARQPGPLWFDHVITHVQIGERDYWLDPTVSDQRGDVAGRSAGNFHHALRLTDDTQALSAMPDVDTTQPQVDVQEVFRLGYENSPAQYHIATTYRGEMATAVRGRLLRSGKRTLAQEYHNYMRQVYPGLRVQGPFDVEDDARHNSITVHERYHIDNMLVWDQQRLNYTLVEYGHSGRLPSVGDSRRLQPLVLPGPFSTRQRTTVIYPQAFDVDVAKQAMSMSFEGPGMQYQRYESSLNRYMTIDSTLTLSADHVNPTDLVAYSAFRERIQRESSAQYWFQTGRDADAVGPLMDQVFSDLDDYGTETAQR